MHFPLSQSLLWLSLLAGVLCEPAPITPLKDDDDALPPTVFNGEQVPPFQELGSVDFEQTVKSGHWLVKFYLPGCIHCKHLAPKWQTLYEFYETLKPVPQSQSTTDKSLNSFTSFYDFHFAGVNCEAFGSLCEKYQAQAFPKVVLFKDGKIEKVFPGKRNDIPELGHSIEEALDSIKPGSRPVKGPKFPKEGDHFADAEAEPEAPVAKDKDRAAGAAAGKKHNEMASVATPTAAIADTVTVETPTATSKSTKTALKPIRPVHSTRVPNELGRSVPLTAEMFQSKVTTTRDPWFIKFYAPWCKYCQAMAPSWAELGRQMQSKLNVGEVNCDEEPRLCKDVKLKGYPTILFFQAGDRIEYDGLRGFGDLLGFAKKAVTAGQGVPDVSAAEFEKMEATEDVIFLYFYDHATATEDFIALEQVTLSLIGHARLVKTNDEALVKRFKVSTWPRLVVVRDTKATYYPALAPQDMRNTNRVVGWMKTVWLPLVPELQATNSLEIMADKLVVLGILSRERPEGFEASKRELKQAALEWMEKTAEMEIRERRELRDAKSLRIKEAEDRGDQRALRAAKSIRIDSEVGDRKRRELTFAWVDGVFWERWVRTSFGIDVRNGERVIVNDELNKRYWDTTITNNPLTPSRTAILETLPHVIHTPPEITPKPSSTRFERFLFHLRHVLSTHPYWTLSLIFGMVVGCYVVLRSRRRGGGLTGSPYGGSAGKKDGAIELGMGLGNGHVKGRSGNHGWLSGVVDEKGGLNGFLGGLAGAGAGGAGGANGKVD